ncbi:RNA-splicing ligase RtcB, partial [Candidatus Woesearchaeota archaeon]|nr:RNA-splicing ligase RtcB [Candidatus Woesearchaeota archaeon]
MNCLAGDSKVLDEFGTVRSIKDFEKTFSNDSIKCLNYTNKVKSTDIMLFMKKKSNKICKIKTSTGYELCATEDHPIYTKSGMTELKNLNLGNQIAIYPFKGVPYEKPEDNYLLIEKDIDLLKLSKTSKLQIINALKSKCLFPLKLN